MSQDRKSPQTDSRSFYASGGTTLVVEAAFAGELEEAVNAAHIEITMLRKALEEARIQLMAHTNDEDCIACALCVIDAAMSLPNTKPGGA